MTDLTMRAASRSLAGRRANNEDSVYASPRLAAVADGVGGAVAGEVASTQAIDEMRALDKRRLTAALMEELRDAVTRANDRIAFLMECRPQLAGMGTTLTAIALSEDRHYLVCNTGDSRSYLLRDRRLRRLTRDDSYVQELIDRGAITAQQARTHPRRSVVMAALDGGPLPVRDPARCRARLGDRLLLCSDGISDPLDDVTLAEILQVPDADEAAHTLASRALAAGGRDNVSAIVADVVARNDPQDGWLPARPAPSTR